MAPLGLVHHASHKYGALLFTRFPLLNKHLMLRSHKAEMLVLLLFEFTLRMLSTLSSYHSPCQDTRGPLWRTKEGSTRHVICILCPNYVFWSTFVKYTSFYLIILLIKIQGVLLLKMDLWRIEEASICHLVCIFWLTWDILKNFC